MHACDLVPPSFSIWVFVCEECRKGSKTKSNVRSRLNRRHSNMYQSTDQSIHNYTILLKTEHGSAPLICWLKNLIVWWLVFLSTFEPNMSIQPYTLLIIKSRGQYWESWQIFGYFHRHLKYWSVLLCPVFSPQILVDPVMPSAGHILCSISSLPVARNRAQIGLERHR